jgi:hypothetical protein
VSADKTGPDQTLRGLQEGTGFSLSPAPIVGYFGCPVCESGPSDALSADDLTDPKTSKDVPARTIATFVLFHPDSALSTSFICNKIRFYLAFIKHIHPFPFVNERTDFDGCFILIFLIFKDGSCILSLLYWSAAQVFNLPNLPIV